jgi:hypothetical protein
MAPCSASEPLELERLDQKVAGAGPDGADRVGDLGAATHHDHRGVRILAPGRLEDVEAVGAGHAQVGQDDVEVLLRQLREATRAIRRDHVEGGRPQQPRQAATEGLFVVTEEKLRHLRHHRLFQVAAGRSNGARPRIRTEQARRSVRLGTGHV